MVRPKVKGRMPSKGTHIQLKANTQIILKWQNDRDGEQASGCQVTGGREEAIYLQLYRGGMREFLRGDGTVGILIVVPVT